MQRDRVELEARQVQARTNATYARLRLGPHSVTSSEVRSTAQTVDYLDASTTGLAIMARLLGLGDTAWTHGQPSNPPPQAPFWSAGGVGRANPALRTGQVFPPSPSIGIRTK